jgi:hypothetical protein
MRQVHSKNCDRGAADGGATHQKRTVPSKVVIPSVATRVEEPSALASQWIDPGQVRTLVVIISEASQCQVSECCLTAVLFRNDVIDFEGNDIELLRHSAVLAPKACAASYCLRRRELHERPVRRAGLRRVCRALDLRTEQSPDTLEVVHFGVFGLGQGPGPILGRKDVHALGCFGGDR